MKVYKIQKSIWNKFQIEEKEAIKQTDKFVFFERFKEAIDCDYYSYAFTEEEALQKRKELILKEIQKNERIIERAQNDIENLKGFLNQ